MPDSKTTVSITTTSSSSSRGENTPVQPPVNNTPVQPPVNVTAVDTKASFNTSSNISEGVASEYKTPAHQTETKDESSSKSLTMDGFILSILGLLAAILVRKKQE